MRRLVPILVLCLAVAAGLLWWQREAVVARIPALAPYIAAGPQAATPPARAAAAGVPVVVTRAEKKAIPLTVEAVGTVQSIASIQIKPRVDSQIVSVNVAEGASVKEGDLLFTLDARTLQAQLAQADAQIARGRAQVEQARRDLGRASELLAKKITSEVQRDTASTAVKVQEAQLAADQAQRENLATLLSYTEIRAPISGRIGSVAAKVGTSVRTADAQALATINQFDPIYVVFAVPQGAFTELRAALAQGKISVDAKVGGATLSGEVAFVENSVDAASGTVIAKAQLPNGEQRLWPGSFVTVQAVVGTQQDAIAIPSSAVQLGQQGPYLFVVRGGKAILQQVTIARTIGANSIVATGLSGGEDVVVEGQLRLVDGAPVTLQSAPSGAGIAQGATKPPS